MIIPVSFTLSGMIILTFFLKKRVRGCSPGVTVLKSFVSLMFMATAVSSVLIFCREKNLFYGLMITSGLCFGMLGDIWLDLKYAHPQGEKIYTYVGFAVFAIGHVFYSAALISRFYVEGNAKSIIIPVLLSLLVAFANIFGEEPLKVNYGEYKAAVIAYTAFIVFLPSLAFSLALANRFRCVPADIAFAAGVMFIVSDAILNSTYFGEGKNRPVDIIANHVLYYLAQFALALSICFA